MNKKGFTLVELLAMLVVLGVLMAVTIPNITGILNQSKDNIIKDDIAKMVDTTKLKISSDEDIKRPKSDHCLVFTLNAINTNDDFKTGPNGGPYDMYNSFVIVKRDGAKYKYYVTLIEEVDGKLYGVKDVDYEDFEKNGDDKIDIINKTPYNKNLTSTSTVTQAYANEYIKGRCDSFGNISGFYK